jgi:hypothetical protein
MRGILALSGGGAEENNYKTLNKFLKLFFRRSHGRETCVIKWKKNFIKKEPSKCGGIDISWRERSMVASLLVERKQ